MIYIILIITIAYLVLIALFAWGFDKVADFKLSDTTAKTTFSIIIPFRNEEKNLPFLLRSISELQYPRELFEVIFINDESTDNSIKVINKDLSNPLIFFGNVQVIDNQRLTNSPKKDAIRMAIKNSKYEWIVTSDADCKLPKYWLDSFDALIQKSNHRCIVAPVKMEGKPSFLTRYQALDFLSLQGATIGSFGINKPILCNGANFAYEKSLFLEVKGFDGNDAIASGDDIFLMEKIVDNHPNQITYLKSDHAIVSTITENSWKSLINQRIRWASKSKSYNNSFAKLTGLIILLMNTLIIGLIILSIINVISLRTMIYVMLIKFSIDFYLLFKTASFLDQQDYLISFITSFFVYPFLSVFIALKALFGTYHWKDRSFKT